MGKAALERAASPESGKNSPRQTTAGTLHRLPSRRQTGSSQPTGEIKKSLADYISVLDDCSAAADPGEERRRFQHHLAAAALMFAAIEKHRSIHRLKELIAAEKHAFERYALSGGSGGAAGKAFADLTARVEKSFPAVASEKKKADQPAKARKEEKKPMEAPKEEKKRFQVQFELFPQQSGGKASYEVFTRMGAAKAIVIAALKHAERQGHPIFRVLPVRPLAGDQPQKTDLLDRLEM